MFFITRLTENTNLAVAIPPYEHIFNAARINISMVRNRFAELDVSGKRRTDFDAGDEGNEFDR
jgi:Ras-related GTP-binding protein A/B